jgi:hypothetical protein
MGVLVFGRSSSPFSLFRGQVYARRVLEGADLHGGYHRPKQNHLKEGCDRSELSKAGLE